MSYNSLRWIVSESQTGQSSDFSGYQTSCSYRKCEKCFITQRVVLTKHFISHFKEKFCRCLEFWKTFSVNSNLVTHKRIHTGRKSSSAVCMRAFSPPHCKRIHPREQLLNAFSVNRTHLIGHQKNSSWGEAPASVGKNNKKNLLTELLT